MARFTKGGVSIKLLRRAIRRGGAAGNQAKADLDRLFARRINLAKFFSRRQFGVDSVDVSTESGRRASRRIFKRAYALARVKTVAAGGRIFSARVDPKIQAKAFVSRTGSRDFYEALNSFPEVAILNVASVMQEVGARTLASVQDKTAVLSGEARDSWNLDFAADGLSFSVSSNWPGIRRLEHGWSRQAGKGSMVRTTQRLIPGFIQTAAARIAGVLR